MANRPVTKSAPRPRVGLLYRAIDTAPAIPLLELAHAASERGFDSIVLGEHTHIPVSRETAFIGGGDLPDTYTRLLDPYVALSFVAAQTPLRIGTCVALVAEHDPIALAKAVATLDHLSNGRLTLGVGFGWNREEFANHGKDYRDRREIVREHVELMQTLWTETEAEYHGVHVNLERSWSWPKPVQPKIPILLGVAAGERAFDAIVQWGDGWMPGGSDADWLAARVGELRRRWVDAGRQESGPIISAMQAVVGDAEFRSQLDRFQELDVAEVLVDIPTAPGDEVLPILDRFAEVLVDLR